MMVNPFLPSVQELFLSLMPRIERHGRAFFRHLKCPHRKQDAVSEMVALSWKWFLRLVERGKNPTRFPSALATYAARAVNSGRKLAGMDRAKDALNPATQKRHGFTVEPLPISCRAGHEQLFSAPRGQQLLDAYEERLRANTITPVPDQVQFRIDWPAWLATLTARERRMIRAMAQNERTKDLSRQFDLSPARISQIRREFRDDWTRFCGERVQAVTA